MLVSVQTNNFQPTENPHSLSLANVVQTPEEFTPGLVASQWLYERRGLQGLGLGFVGQGRPGLTGLPGGLGCTGACSGCSGMAGCPGMSGGLGLDLETLAGTSAVWMALGGGLLLYWMVAGSPAKERRAALRSAKSEYQAKVRKIKGTHSRFYSSRSRSDSAPAGKRWIKGAYRSEDYEE